jgi:hypothetical protein
MKYMLMMNCPRDGYDQFTSWGRQDDEHAGAELSAHARGAAR